MSIHHKLDIRPIPEKVLYINEPWLIDPRFNYREELPLKSKEEDNVRIYVPIDLNADHIIGRLYYIIDRYGEATYQNEIPFSCDVERLIYQIEIYDQVWFVRKGNYKLDKNHMIVGHSVEAEELVRRFVAVLEDVIVTSAEMFPRDVIQELKREYLGE